MFKYTSIQDYHTDLLNGTVLCTDAVQHFLLQIDKRSNLNAYTQVFSEEAMQKAAALDQQRKDGKPMGKLHGVVISIKDVICYKDHAISAGSKILQNFNSVYNATAVERLLAEDAIIIGVTNCDEFAMGSTNENSAHGKVLNALDETRVPGGSSGGSAVAVQAGLCMVSLGSDTGGSVRQPADFCGVVGFKPSYGRISRYGLIAYASSFDQIGIFANNVPDVAQVLEVIAGEDEFDSTAASEAVPAAAAVTTAPVKPLRIAYFREALESPALDAEIKENILALIDKLKADGHTVSPVDFEYLDYIVPAYYVLTTAESSSNLSRFDGVKYGFRADVDKKTDLTDFYKASRSGGFGWEVKRRIMLGTFVLSAGYYDAYFTKAQQVRQLLVNKTNMVFNQFDALILPTAPTTAFRIGEKMEDPIAMYLADIFTVFSNLTGIPGISIPLFWHSNGMPYGLQIMTNRFCELSLLQLSHQWIQRYRFAG
ncbi:Asp-tRNA(Asn)/Glu-tRNA(Gln) amidotransferase subunit GatA [Pseudoflavitalea sp. G-6-1-2]|uniref:Asp-tRNA(Asn)/Glu-tRNA(Gln) amidotransferase subunit GatA n=1 Tax=Pseudoflavitalea sp. G-6-1-2 TaxID=2728841 RepID=UPI00146C96AE|nr:Asp-tRNA(Asn)/Glu-tRNA(Gln) amidotransferase subunit GatA [Pseudoflavitalea sp. G-6-1-2]NML20578.1 Asp-tRNA(Asn)/Glu-tRNA(Gln) amidotransferase subunit GatA [Pseudoflavitalea sp. G-6-1-2]